MRKDHETEIRQGERFEFGANWQNFLSVLDDERIEEAMSSLQKMLDNQSLSGKAFLDIGSGSGLSSLVARTLGAKVHSFDYDPKSVECTAELRRRYFPNDADWVIEEGSILNADYLKRLGEFDIVYSWGVLHHTGQMSQALANVVPLVKKGGDLFIAIYNDQGGTSHRWRWVKKIYCSNFIGRVLMKFIFFPYFALGRALNDLLKRENPFASYSAYKKSRGMSVLHDWVDWLGGYPFEVAKPEEIFDYFHKQNFELVRMKTCGGGLGCNEFVFSRKK
ncbi:MAG: class I SAM-dependent methyltransferase [Ramlibacter sp.]|nr:class I SAM-dependent methyltransferase [Ramlibacter sp.]